MSAAAPVHTIHAEAPPIRVTDVHAEYGRFDAIIAEAEAIAKAVVEAKIDKTEHKKIDELLAKLQTKHRDFNASFPIPMRMIVQKQDFSRDVFVKYLRYYQSVTREESKISLAPFSTKQRFLEVQAEYCVMCAKHANPKYDHKRLQQYRTDTIARLVAEDKKITKIQEQILAEDKKRKDEAADLARKEILKLALAAKAK